MSVDLDSSRSGTLSLVHHSSCYVHEQHSFQKFVAESHTPRTVMSRRFFLVMFLVMSAPGRSSSANPQEAVRESTDSSSSTDSTKSHSCHAHRISQVQSSPSES